MNDRTSPTGEPEDEGVREEIHRSPAWAKAFLLAALLGLVVIVLVLLLGGEHGPARHSPTAGTAERLDSHHGRPAVVPTPSAVWFA